MTITRKQIAQLASSAKIEKRNARTTYEKEQFQLAYEGLYALLKMDDVMLDETIAAIQEVGDE